MIHIKYTPALSRFFLFCDEWIGISVLLYAWHIRDWWLFFLFGIPWAIAVYGIGYQQQWAFEKRVWKRERWHQCKGDDLE